MTTSRPDGGLPASDITRRTLLRGAGSGVLAVGGASVIAACGGSSTSGSSTSGSGSGTTASPVSDQGGTPKAGGTFRLGASGGSTADTLDAQNLLRTATMPVDLLCTKGARLRTRPDRPSTCWPNPSRATVTRLSGRLEFGPESSLTMGSRSGQRMSSLASSA